MMIARAGVVLFVRRKLGATCVLAVTNRGYGGMSLPGGKIEEGEEIRSGACREVLEETSVIVRVEDLSFLTKGDSIRKDSHYEVSVFNARFAYGEAKNVEHGTFHQWIEWQELLEFSPFAEFYDRHFPDGIVHVRDTIFVNAANAPRRGKA